MTTKTHNKLVRDKIPAYLSEKGISSEVVVLGKDEYKKELRKKLQEEVDEYFAAETLEQRNEERADIAEVLIWLDKLDNLTPRDLECIREMKFEERGGFERMIFLISTSE